MELSKKLEDKAVKLGYCIAEWYDNHCFVKRNVALQACLKCCSKKEEECNEDYSCCTTAFIEVAPYEAIGVNELLKKVALFEIRAKDCRKNNIKKIPFELKKLLRKMQKLSSESKAVGAKISELLEQYNVPEEALRADSDYEKMTEALAFIEYDEGTIEDNIKDIESVFLYDSNKS
ncbi:hypothetical protein IAI10_16690 [Clostridium sp. 19966]|uniref:hypothetical protein n=1 Tax=Clostridium sp. 19966 TaxID=2768166 RepID=UPI0028DFA819|nr:hypothetical protein [Clostridium sp. 19966]MDT8718307.1 hypothetical protein [Clostridium sp. 19966]